MIGSRNIEEPPAIQLTFANGKLDHIILEHYKINKYSPVGCNYLGHLQSDLSSSVAVTGCLNNPEDQMEVTMITDSFHKMLSVSLAVRFAF